MPALSSPYTRRQPCNNCPYRLDAPRAHWAREEFADLLKNECSELGAVYGCHKKDGHTCVGWLMNQLAHGLPSIMLRVSLSKHGVTAAYLDSLTLPAGLFASVAEMIAANFPELLPSPTEQNEKGQTPHQRRRKN